MNQQKAYRLANIIIQVKLGYATEDERCELLGWLDEHEANRKVYVRIIRGESIRERVIAEEQVRVKADVEHVYTQIVGEFKQRRIHRIVRTWSIIAAAACVCGFTMTHLFGIYTQEVRQIDSPVVQLVAQSKVRLILQSGEQINLESGLSEKRDIGEVLITNSAGELVYETKQESSLEESLNRVITEIGGEYCLRLSDGTRVWLNATSELEFPVDFIQEKRMVRLSGEAYFEVAPDSKRPFIVETGDMQTEVLGTSFNIQAYPNEEAVYTSLLTGKVKVALLASDQSITLTPGMEAIWKKASHDIRAERANVGNSIAWRYGKFVFDETDIEVVTRMLSRWYEVEFVFDGGRKGKHTFTGQMSKDQTLEEVLETMVLAGGPTFRKEGNIIHVIEK